MNYRIRSRLLSVLVASVTVGAAVGPAAAAPPPPVDPGQLPAAAPAAPTQPTEQKNQCFATRPVPAGPQEPPAQRALGFRAAWPLTRGAGQTIAVIDTGVARHPRLSGLIPAGDYVGTGDGTDDCDVHGTVVAGLIAAAGVPGQGFAGVAPDARIMTIRQSSNLWQVAGRAQQQRPEDNADGYGDVATMAAAVRLAADRGATVINISEVACSTATIDDRALGAAVQYAMVERDAVVVAAAGNKDGRCGSGNPDSDPRRPTADPWQRVDTIVTPAWYDDYVLTVGSVDANGAPSRFTVPGPWVDVAAPGEGIVSLDPRSSGLTDAKLDDKGTSATFQGTSFAAPYVAGTVALVRARFPELRARQVMARIEATAHTPPEGINPYVGHGSIDPYAAVTVQPPDVSPAAQPNAPASTTLATPTAPASPDRHGATVALIGTAVLGVGLVLGFLAWFPLRRRARAAAARGEPDEPAAPTE
ncbi:type VII secretion-associated serine protease mycosin [Skermania piniformis]|uniref:Type VII secretion-associated serine protease mycosin n=1 Tax=Skermania pinensis TaxID=39122 RepID=A0ABX8S9S7_9ACTN|nr:type VII secretion-associated serine protease mycosin [Skermania piniformis]QXQ14619.1 type VII secretion-associated serine protease mycosin [Skermania piniformis]